MKTFTDNKDRVWEVELNIRQMKRVRDVLGIDLVNVISANKDGTVSTDTLERVANDPILLVDILWVLCEGQAKPAPLLAHPPDGGQPAAGGYGVTDFPRVPAACRWSRPVGKRPTRSESEGERGGCIFGRRSTSQGSTRGRARRFSRRCWKAPSSRTV